MPVSHTMIRPITLFGPRLAVEVHGPVSVLKEPNTQQQPDGFSSQTTKAVGRVAMRLILSATFLSDTSSLVTTGTLF